MRVSSKSITVALILVDIELKYVARPVKWI